MHCRGIGVDIASLYRSVKCCGHEKQLDKSRIVRRIGVRVSVGERAPNNLRRSEEVPGWDKSFERLTKFIC